MREDGLAGDRERRVVEEVVGLGDRAGERALDGEDADVDRAVGRRLRHGGEARERDELGGVAEETVARRGAVGAVSAGVADDGWCRCGFGHRVVPEGSKESASVR